MRNRILRKSNFRGFISQTTESNERLKIWLLFLASPTCVATNYLMRWLL